jgi:hypothetical protein
MNDLIQQLAAAVTAMGPTQDVELAGSWSTSKRKTYKTGSQAGSGACPFVEVLDARWRATLKCAVPIVGFAFMDTPTQTLWVKSIAPAVAPHVEVSLHAHTEFLPGRASFTGSLFDAVVPAVPVACGENPIQTCTLGPAHTETGSAHGVARVNGVAFVILLLPKTFVKVGRNRLWHFRPEFASSLDNSLRLFADGRTGTLRRDASGKCDAV